MRNTVPEADDYRHERKFVTTDLPTAYVRGVVQLHPAAFREVHPVRFVNNLYLDCGSHSSYRSSVEGHGERLKVRVRWYGEVLGPIRDPVLELKIKQNSLGRKERFSLPAFTFGPEFDGEALAQLFRDADLPDVVRPVLGGLNLTLLVRYRREYYEAATPGAIRLTTDDGLSYCALGSRRNTLARWFSDRRTTVIELKYLPAMERAAREVSQGLPFRVTKQSKYVMGLERVQLRHAF